MYTIVFIAVSKYETKIVKLLFTLTFTAKKNN